MVLGSLGNTYVFVNKFFRRIDFAAEKAYAPNMRNHSQNPWFVAVCIPVAILGTTAILTYLMLNQGDNRSASSSAESGHLQIAASIHSEKSHSDDSHKGDAQLSHGVEKPYHLHKTDTKFAEEHDKLRSEISNLRRQLQREKRQLQREKAAREIADKKVEQLEAITPKDDANEKKLVGLISQNEGRMELMRNEIELAGKQNSDLRQQVAQLGKENVKITAKLEKAQTELKASQRKIADWEQRLNDNNSQSNQPADPDPKLAPSADSAAFGLIASMDTKFDFVVINRGSEHEVKVGDIFRVVSRISGDFLGQLIITRVQSSVAIGNMGRQSIKRLRSGDLLYR